MIDLPIFLRIQKYKEKRNEYAVSAEGSGVREESIGLSGRADPNDRDVLVGEFRALHMRSTNHRPLIVSGTALVSFEVATESLICQANRRNRNRS